MGCNSLANPFYVDACGIQSEQTLTVYNYFYSSALLTANSFVIPSCNSVFTVTVSGLAKTAPDMYIWNPLYGYFKIINYNCSTCELTLQNECHTVNASPGFGVPECTTFLVVDTPCCFNATDYLNYPYLAVDFVVPAEDSCVTIKLTNVHSIVVGQFVVIAGGTYYVNEVLSATDIVICNQGAGGVPGSVVYAKNYSEEYITPVTVEWQEICDRDPLYRGALTVCTSSINSSVLSGSLPLFVPALVDTDTNFVEFVDPNDAYALSICSQDLSTSIDNFVQEYSDVSAAGMKSNPAPHDDTATVTVYIQNDTCNYCLMDIVVQAIAEITAYPLAGGEWASFSYNVFSESFPSASASPSESPSASPSESPSGSPSPSATPSSSPSSSPSGSPSGSPSAGHSPSSSPSASPSESPSVSPSPSSSPSESPSVSPSPSSSPSASPSSSPSASPSASASPSSSPSVTPSLPADNACDIDIYEEYAFKHAGASCVSMTAIDWLRGRLLGPGEIDAYDIILTVTWEAGTLNQASFDNTELDVFVFGTAI